ncbi:MAG: hypothetical protein EHM40_05335 [Chloroflexi bacterium]|nr:MAG: hypothetical protein EHM40_05335 [Chloroflexota bacterium]
MKTIKHTRKITRTKNYKFKLSSGLFGLPGNAASVDWAVLNDAAKAQSFKVTVYKAGVDQLKTVVAPGPLTFSLDRGKATHNANSVGINEPFVPGFYYEVVLEADSLSLMPTVSIWEDHGCKVIPGTTILPGVFVKVE